MPYFDTSEKFEMLNQELQKCKLQLLEKDEIISALVNKVETLEDELEGKTIESFPKAQVDYPQSGLEALLKKYSLESEKIRELN